MIEWRHWLGMILPDAKGFDMSYKDLEAEIKAWANLEAYAKKQKEDKQEAKRQAKRDKRAKKEGKHKGPLIPRLPAPKIERPFKTIKRITIQCKPIDHPVHGEEVELTYEIETLTDAVAEVEAIKKAREHGYSFDKVIYIATVQR